MIDWSALVANSTPKTPENTDLAPLFPQKVGTNRGGVGTDFYSQVIETELFLNSVPTVPAVPTVLEEARVSEQEKSNPLSFSKPAGGEVKEQFAPHKTTFETSCKTCAHMYRPGLSDGHCGGRDDLPYAYSPGHPLRKLPPDGGASCQTWALHPAWEGAELCPAPHARRGQG